MGEVNMAGVFLGALAFLALGFVWYHWLFGERWRRETGMSREDLRATHPRLRLLLAFLFMLLIALMLGHQYARSMPPPHVTMMIATGFGATIMTPALGIHYLFQRRSGVLFAIDAGYLILGMTLMGGVFVALN